MQKPTPPVAPKPKLVLPQRPGLSANVDQTEKMEYEGKAEANRTPCPKAPLCLNNNRQEMDNNSVCHVTNTNPEQNVQKRGSNNNYLINNEPLQEVLTVTRSPNTNTDTSSPTTPPVSHRAWSHEGKGNTMPLSAQENPCRSTQLTCVLKPKPVPARKPVSLPQNPRKAGVLYQEKVEERKEIRGNEVNVKEVKISPEEKNNSSLSAGKSWVRVMVMEGQMPDSARHDMKKCPNGGQERPQNTKEYVKTEYRFTCPPMEIHQKLDRDELGTGVEESVYNTSLPVGSRASMYDAEELYVQMDKDTGHLLKNDGDEKNNSSLSVCVPVPVMNRPVSQNKHPFFLSPRKPWVRVMMTEGQMPDSTRHDMNRCPNRGQDIPQNIKEYVKTKNRFSCPLMGIHQKLDRDKIGTGVEGLLYETLLPLGSRASMYDGEELHMPMDRDTGHLLKHDGDKRGTFDESEELLDTEPFDDEDYYFDDDEFDDDDDDDDQSSTSSKGDPEQPEEMLTQSGLKNRLRHIATEIMTSERVFVDVLKLLHIDFRDAVYKASHQSGKPVIEERLLNQILHYLPQLYELNQDLLTELEHRVDRWETNAQVADIFLKKGHYLKMHSTYIRELDKNVALLEEQSKKNAAFGAVVREFEASPRCGNLALKHYLVKPVQRIAQYQLLLTNYLKSLPVDAKDYNDTEAALGIVKEVANHANDIMKHGDNFQKLIEVQCRLTGQHEILKPSRIFLKEGILNKLSRKIMQPRMFFLFNDVLLYTTPLQLGQYKLNNMLSLAGMKVSKPNQEAYQNELNIESIERSFILSASSAAERDDWLQAISTAISDYTKKEISFISGDPPQELEMDSTEAPLGSKAPIWIPDARATMCMICTCEFTLTWRRHHCRACGKVVCDSCSSNKRHLEYLKNQRARVCDHCFVILLQQKSKQAQSADLSSNNVSNFPFIRKQKKIPAILKEVSANTDNSSMSGYLQMSKSSKTQWKRLWFVIKDKVLYTYAASEDLVALESQPLLGFMLKEYSFQKLNFKIYHKDILYYIFKADDIQTAKRWIDSFKEAMVM